MHAPALRPPVIRDVFVDGWHIRLDISAQVLRVEIPEYVRERELLPQLARSSGGSVSAAMLLLKAKQFDEGLYAAVELAAQNGAGRFWAKATMLKSLAKALRSGDAGALIHAACQFGGVEVETPADLHPRIEAIVEEFLANEAASKPLGFYTWSAKLWSIFRQDRLLQQPLNATVADTLARTLGALPDTHKAYQAWLHLASRLTNPAGWPGLFDPPDKEGKRAFFPPSRSCEVTLFEELFRRRIIPDNFDLMTELISRVRSGQISLTPTEDAGWYDRQTWSLEPLIVPERMPVAGRLTLGRRYLQHLEDLFRGTLALTRETHAKQAGGGYGGGYCGPEVPPVWVHPRLSVEPLPSLYARRAKCYRFVRSVLVEAFGAATLKQLHRLRREGPVEPHLADELDSMQTLFESAAATAAAEIGHATSPNGNRFSAWPWDKDEDVCGDARMMVPVFYDEARQKTKVWAVLGWKKMPVDVAYATDPTVLSIEPRKKSKQQPTVMFASDRYEFAVPVMVEMHVTKLLDRDEFRRHCDRWRTHQSILANLR